MNKFSHAAAAAALTLIPLAALSQEVTGEITATIDGDQRTWFIVESNGASQSSWKGTGGYADVLLFGHASDDTITDETEALTIRFGVTNLDGTNTTELPEIAYLKDGLLESYVADSENAEVSVNSMEVEGERLAISGTFEATLGFTDDLGQTVDMSRSREISGSFDAVIGSGR